MNPLLASRIITHENDRRLNRTIDGKNRYQSSMLEVLHSSISPGEVA